MKKYFITLLITSIVVLLPGCDLSKMNERIAVIDNQTSSEQIITITDGNGKQAFTFAAGEKKELTVLAPFTVDEHYSYKYKVTSSYVGNTFYYTFTDIAPINITINNPLPVAIVIADADNCLDCKKAEPCKSCDECITTYECTEDCPDCNGNCDDCTKCPNFLNCKYCIIHHECSNPAGCPDCELCKFPVTIPAGSSKTVSVYKKLPHNLEISELNNGSSIPLTWSDVLNCYVYTTGSDKYYFNFEYDKSNMTITISCETF